jgi:hypothetical protein
MGPIILNFDGYAEYLPAIQDYYVSFPLNQQQPTPPLPSNLTHRDLDFLHASSALFSLRAALYSAGVAAGTNTASLARPTVDMISRRAVNATFLLGDSGGFQAIQPNGLVVTDKVRIDVLRWLERLCDSGLILDIPTAATEVVGGPFYRDMHKCLEETQRSLEIFMTQRNPASPLRLVNVLQGHTNRDALTWYYGMKQYWINATRIVWSGDWAWGGSRRFDLRHVILLLLRMEDEGCLAGTHHIHFLGVGDLGFALCLRALKHGVSARLGRDIRLTFDTATPMLMANKYNRSIAGAQWGKRGLPLLTYQFSKGSAGIRDDRPLPWDNSALASRLRYADLRRIQDPHAGWDQVGRVLLSNHNVEALCRAIIQANRYADSPGVISKFIPRDIMIVREVIQEAFDARHPASHIKKYPQLSMFSEAEQAAEEELS